MAQSLRELRRTAGRFTVDGSLLLAEAVAFAMRPVGRLDALDTAPAVPWRVGNSRI
jgi:hypothetical protein